jgi:hypothetical protein
MLNEIFNNIKGLSNLFNSTNCSADMTINKLICYQTDCNNGQITKSTFKNIFLTTSLITSDFGTYSYHKKNYNLPIIQLQLPKLIDINSNYKEKSLEYDVKASTSDNQYNFSKKIKTGLNKHLELIFNINDSGDLIMETKILNN